MPTSEWSHESSQKHDLSITPTSPIPFRPTEQLHPSPLIISTTQPSPLLTPTTQPTPLLTPLQACDTLRQFDTHHDSIHTENTPVDVVLFTTDDGCNDAKLRKLTLFRDMSSVFHTHFSFASILFTNTSSLRALFSNSTTLLSSNYEFDSPLPHTKRESVRSSDHHLHVPRGTTTLRRSVLRIRQLRHPSRARHLRRSQLLFCTGSRRQTRASRFLSLMTSSLA